MENNRQNEERAGGRDAAASGLGKNWGEDSREERHPDAEPAFPDPEEDEPEEKDLVDEESEESFPASDAPSFLPTKVS